MALWDDLSRKASGTKAKAVQQAKNLSEVTRLNGLISDQKKKIEENYYALGEQYAQLHREDYEDALAGFMTAILEAQRIILESQDQIREIKGVQCCTNCGAELSKDTAFCSSCGTPVPKPKAPEGPVCSNCGAVLAEGMRFCTGCGTPVAQKAPEAAPAPEETPAPQPRLCPQCNAQLDDEAAFCMNCGTKVQ